MRLRFVFLGYEIWSLGFVDEPEAEYAESDGSEEGGAELSIGGGSGMCFERDGTPLSPVGEEPWPWETDKFGFQA